ncbi:hypothetical protein Tco_0076002, partial [Tanacetum coccineum]
ITTTMESEVVALEGWQNLRVVETIYEEDSGDESVSSTATSLASPVHPSSPSSASLRTRVKLW